LPAELRAAAGPGLRDATSVYGYPGPVCSQESIPAMVLRNFQASLRERLRQMQVVSVFSRLNPVLPQRPLLAGLGEFHVAPTVAIDLTLSPGEQAARFRKTHRAQIAKLRQHGVRCVHDEQGVHLPDFIRIYHDTMRRVNASERYFFSPAYFERLWSALGPRRHLFLCLWENIVLCGGLFVTCEGILQHHLGGTCTDALKLSPMKLLLDDVRLWGTAQGLRVLHLGGGATSAPADPLLHFKRGFSDRTQEFASWRWVVLPEVYDLLCAARPRCRETAHVPGAAHFFPAYRSPLPSWTNRIPG
jgi:hypothetical protein